MGCVESTTSIRTCFGLISTDNNFNDFFDVKKEPNNPGNPVSMLHNNQNDEIFSNNNSNYNVSDLNEQKNDILHKNTNNNTNNNISSNNLNIRDFNAQNQNINVSNEAGNNGNNININSPPDLNPNKNTHNVHTENVQCVSNKECSNNINNKSIKVNENNNKEKSISPNEEEQQPLINKNPQIINYPKLKLEIINNERLELRKLNNEVEYTKTLFLTPNSITTNDDVPRIFEEGHKYFFGKDSSNECKLESLKLLDKQFHIYYNKEDNKFYAVDLTKELARGNSLYIKIKDHLCINGSIVVNFPSNFSMHLSTEINNSSKDIIIRFIQHTAEENKREHIFKSSEIQSITIGKSKSCNILCKDKEVSKVQCTILFINNNWVLYDGGFIDGNQKHSLNGIWLYALDVALYDKSILRVGPYIININVDNQ